MSMTIPVLWPETIRTNVQTPFAILRTQAEALANMTNGVLEGSVEVGASGNKQVSISLSVLAPALNYKHLILSARHSRTLPYPARILAECFNSGGSEYDAHHYGFREAVNPEMFEECVGLVLKSPEVETVLVSLIARSNDPMAEGQFAELDNNQNEDLTPS